MSELSQTELIVAESYGRGLIDKEVAEYLNKPLWTIKTHKKHIYQKLGISTTHEIILFLVCRKLGKTFDLNEIRNKGLSAIFSVLFLYMGCFDVQQDVFRVRTQRVNRTAMRAQRGRRCRTNDCIIDEMDW